MRRIVDYLKANLLVVGLVAVILGFIVYFLTVNTTTQQVVAPAPMPTIQQPGQVAIVPSGTTTFCLQLDGRGDGHLPDLMGAAAKDAYANGLSGRNWSLPATSSGDEDYGILPDGTIFAKMSFLQQYGMVESCNLKADRTGWQPVPGIAQAVNGADALVWK